MDGTDDSKGNERYIVVEKQRRGIEEEKEMGREGYSQGRRWEEGDIIKGKRWQGRDIGMEGDGSHNIVEDKERRVKVWNIGKGKEAKGM